MQTCGRVKPVLGMPTLSLLIIGFQIQILDFIVFNATFNYIMATSFSSGRSRREPHGQATGKLYHLRLRVYNVVSSTTCQRGIQTYNISGDMH
jgi:hypothetical protein